MKNDQSLCYRGKGKVLLVKRKRMKLWSFQAVPDGANHQGYWVTQTHSLTRVLGGVVGDVCRQLSGTACEMRPQPWEASGVWKSDGWNWTPNSVTLRLQGDGQHCLCSLLAHCWTPKHPIKRRYWRDAHIDFSSISHYEKGSNFHTEINAMQTGSCVDSR